jgi:hypothetical protein
MIGVALLLNGFLQADPGAFAALSLSAGYAKEWSGEGDLIGGMHDGNSAFARGVGLSTDLEVLGGYPLIKVGARTRAIWVPGNSTALSWLLLGGLRIGEEIFFEASGGIGYAYAQRPNLFLPTQIIRNGEWGGAVALQAGYRFDPRLTLVIKADLLTGLPGMVDLAGGIEWRL